MEEDDAACCNLVDPLARYSGLSLFPNVCGLSFDDSNPNEPETELDYIHKRLMAEALRCPKKLVEQVVSIAGDGSEILNGKIMSYLPRENKNEEVGVAVMEQPQERRPAFNRKRARFSLKPDSCLTVMNLEQSMDISKIKDPEEYFLAFERLEKAKREIRKQTGCFVPELDQATPSPIIRPRRPEIPRKSVKYKHLFSSLVSKNEENVVSYQEDVRKDSLNLSSLISEQKLNRYISVQEREYLDSSRNMNNEVDKILDELLSGDCKDLEGNEAIRLLEERLQIKPIELETLSLPNLECLRSTNLKAVRVNLTKPQNSLLDTGNLVKERRAPEEKHRLFSHLTSPTTSTSPFASLTSLKKRILQPNPVNDPFSAHEIDELPARNISSFESTDEQCGPFNTNNHSNTSHGTPSTSHGKDAIGSNKNGSNEVNEYLIGYSKSCETENSFEDGNANVNSSKFYIDINAGTRENLHKSEIREESHRPKVKADDRKRKRKEVVQTEPNDTLEDSIEEDLHIIQQQLGKSSTAIVMKDARNAFENASGRNDEENEIQESEVVMKKKQKRRMVNKDKKSLRRVSLAAAGTTWESGLRRSTRIKIRPLEFWKGEKFLYGRIHQSLTTVIGLKYVSPAKGGGQPTLKVKSYVSDEYKDLVEFAALH